MITAWLNVKMKTFDQAAMKEGVQNSTMCVAIISDGDGTDGTAYFQRDFCKKELRWARDANVFIQPVINIDDKTRIGEFMQQAPEDLKFLGGINFLKLYRGSLDFWDKSVNRVVGVLNDTKVPNANLIEEFAENIYALNQKQMPASATPNAGIGSTTPALVDGKEFFKRARERLSYEQFSAFLQNIKDLNERRKTREEALGRAKQIFGSEGADLYASFEGLLSRQPQLGVSSQKATRKCDLKTSVFHMPPRGGECHGNLAVKTNVTRKSLYSYRIPILLLVKVRTWWLSLIHISEPTRPY